MLNRRCSPHVGQHEVLTRLNILYPYYLKQLFHIRWNGKVYIGMVYFLQIKFNKKVYTEKIEIYETYHSGAVKRLQLMQPNNKWYTVWQTENVKSIEKLRTFSPDFNVSFSVFFNLNRQSFNTCIVKYGICFTLKVIRHSTLLNPSLVLHILF